MIAAFGLLLLLADAGPAEPVPEPVPEPAGLGAEHLHLVIERRGDRVSVDQMWRLVGGDDSDARALRLPLPAGAMAPQPSGPKGAPPTVVLEGSTFRLTRPIPPDGLDVALRFELPIEEGHAALRQRLPVPVARAEIVSTWTASGATLAVEGVGPGRPSKLANGMIALVVQGQGLAGQLVVRLTGLEHPEQSALPRATLVACVLLLLVGFGIWLKRR
jgi:hypothetical protein